MGMRLDNLPKVPIHDNIALSPFMIMYITLASLNYLTALNYVMC